MMINLAIKYLTFHGYLIITPEERQAAKHEHEHCDCEEEVNPFELAYQEGFHDGRQLVLH